LREKIEQSLFVRGISSFGASRMMMLTPVADWPKIEMVRLGVDISAFRPADHTGDGVELLCVGRLSAEKGHHILLDALALVVAEYRAVTIRLRLVGDGPDRAALAQHAEKLGIQEHVIFEGWANHDRVLEFYQRADIFLLASFAEGIPVVLMEAMAMELPVVATWISGIPELVDSGQNGLLCAPGDADALAANIHKLISDPDLRKRLGAAGRRTVLDQFDLAANAKEWAAVLRRRLSARGEPIPMRAIEDP
jgi:glycosyltransferase involved in cell wall biosynthesis